MATAAAAPSAGAAVLEASPGRAATAPGAGTSSTGCAVHVGGGAAGGAGHAISTHLYSFEFQLHNMQRFKTMPPEGGQLRLAVRLWDFPTLFIDCTAEYEVGYPSLLEKGKACLFQADPVVVNGALPLPMQCILFDERGPTQRRVIGSATIPVGEGQRATSLTSNLHRYDLPINDPYGAPYCELCVSLDLRCVGPYHKRDAPHYGQTPAPTVRKLPPADARCTPDTTFGAFFRQEVGQQLASLAHLTQLYERLDGVTVGGCCRGGRGTGAAGAASVALARNVFDHQISLLQQLQHNTQKLVAMAEEEHLRQYGFAFAPPPPATIPGARGARGARRARVRPIAHDGDGDGDACAGGSGAENTDGGSPARTHTRRRKSQRLVRIDADGLVVPIGSHASQSQGGGTRRRKKFEAQRVFDAYLSKEYIGVHAALYIAVAGAVAAAACPPPRTAVASPLPATPPALSPIVMKAEYETPAAATTTTTTTATTTAQPPTAAAAKPAAPSAAAAPPPQPPPDEDAVEYASDFGDESALGQSGANDNIAVGVDDEIASDFSAP